MSNLVDVFNQDAFNIVSLTDALNVMPRVPGRLGELQVFTENGINTPQAAFEEKDGQLYLIENAVRGGVAKSHEHSSRKIRSFVVPHLVVHDRLGADELIGKRQFGTNDIVAGIQETVMERFAEMQISHEATLEHLRIGAVKGIILDSDGTTEILNLFDAFGVSQTTETIDFGDDKDDVQLKALAIKRAIRDNMGAIPVAQYRVLCSPSFFDLLISNSLVRAAYDRWREGSFLRSDPRDGFDFGGLIWEEYEGSVGSIDFIADDTAYALPLGPVGGPSIFQTKFAPANYVETVGTKGLPVYAKQEILDFGKGVLLESQSNPLAMNTRPQAVVKITGSST